MEWHLINTRKQLERDEPKTDLFSDILFKELKKKEKPANSPESLIRKEIAKLIVKSIPYVCGKTRGWTLDEMEQTYLKAMSWKTNPAAFMNKLIRVKNEEIKKQLSTN